MKRLFLLSAVLGAAVFFLAYGPITVKVSISTGSADTAPSGDTVGGAGEARAATKMGTNANDTLMGTIHRDFMDGRGGDDTLTGGDGKDIMQGDGARPHNGDPQGADTLYGNAGGDNISGGGGADKIYSGAGDDAIYADDDEVDTVNCGGGYGDFAFVDPDDRVTGCENVVDNGEWWVIQGV